MEKKSNKKVLKVIGLLGLFLLVFGLSYALFTVTLNGTKKVKVKTGKLELQLLDENNQDITDSNNAGYSINLDNQVPVDDTTGLGTEGFTFKLKNIGTIDARYTIYLDDVALEEREDRLPDSAVRYSLTKNGSEENPSDLTSIGIAPNRKLDEGVIKQDTTNTYTLKVWIDEDATNEAMDKVFNATLRVEGTQYVAPPASESEYGEEIANTQLSNNLTATYYQPGGTGYNNTNNIKRMSDVKKIDNEITYYGGTLVISGNGEMEDYDEANYDLMLFLMDATMEEVMNNTEKYMGPNGFIYKYNPTNLIIEEGVTKVGNISFRDISPLVNVTLPSTVTTIGEYAFSGTSVESIDIPYGVITIGLHSFSDTNLTRVKLPSSVLTVEYSAFSDTPLVEILVEGNSTLFETSGGSDGAGIPKSVTIYVKNQNAYNNIQNQQPLHAVGGNVSVVLDPTKFE